MDKLNSNLYFYLSFRVFRAFRGLEKKEFRGRNGKHLWKIRASDFCGKIQIGTKAQYWIGVSRVKEITGPSQFRKELSEPIKTINVSMNHLGIFHSASPSGVTWGFTFLLSLPWHWGFSCISDQRISYSSWMICATCFIWIRSSTEAIGFVLLAFDSIVQRHLPSGKVSTS